MISEKRYVKAKRVDTDNDYAGCVLTRKNTTCAHFFHGVNLIKAGSWTEGTRSLSVAESEFYAGVKDGSILLGAQSMMIDFGEKMLRSVFLVRTAVSQEYHGENWGRTDSTSALCYALFARTCGSGEMRTEKRKGEHNTADTGTMAVTAPVLRKHLKTLKMEWRDGQREPACVCVNLWSVR